MSYHKYFTSLGEGKTNTLGLVEKAFRHGENTEEQLLAAYFLASVADTDYKMEINVFYARFPDCKADRKVLERVINDSLAHFVDQRLPVHPIIGELNRYMSAARRVNTVLRNGGQSSFKRLWEELVNQTYANPHLQKEHEDLVSVLSSQIDVVAEPSVICAEEVISSMSRDPYSSERDFRKELLTPYKPPGVPEPAAPVDKQEVSKSLPVRTPKVALPLPEAPPE